ncbi:serine hydrolase domain-containing protein [Pedobacter faecalis]|uniref:serine hydrolase domain-containing protein n=1 Tax=Pedobacter faecalis TaxID=3041495 RepID=UPI00254BFC67|nr:serine hydrolase [Pedobacter sp. ELA7]
MRRKNFVRLVIICLHTLITFNACAQNHQHNQQILAVSNTVIRNTVLLNNERGIIPLRSLNEKNIASVGLDFSGQPLFDSLANKYAQVTSFTTGNYKNATGLDALEENLKFFNTVIISLPAQRISDSRNRNFIFNVARTKDVVLCLFGGLSSLSLLDSLNAPLIWTDQSTPIAYTLVPQAIFGGIALDKKLNSTLSAKYVAGSGFSTTATRLKYTLPEDAGVNTEDLQEIDDIAMEAIRARATPGMVVLAAKDGKVIFNKAYGSHTYADTVQERVSDIFDIASVTKTTATTPAVMRLFEERRLNLDTNVGAYIPRARTQPMNPVRLREVMLHQAGFIPYIAFHDYVKPSDHSRDSSAAYPTQVADGYYIRQNFFEEMMWPKMLATPLRTRGKYVYSDISMYVMKEIVEQISGSRLDEYVMENFYKPLGMQTAGFSPRKRFDRALIVPTEQDTYFRKTLLHGFVHDQGAALTGGISGHAGLFASANDLAIFYQMLLNKGTYGGAQIFKPETVVLFTAQQANVSRRGLGFDRWDPDKTKNYPSELASPQTFGHTGYTGTCVWVDPSRQLVYIFLSNRVHPAASNKLSTMKIRGRIQDVLNRAVDKSKRTAPSP